MSLSKKGGSPWTCRRRNLAEVLAQIGRQAGIRISSGPSSGKRVSARFAGVELEEGLRRLLRAVSLSHIFLYANGPAGTVTISEVRVLGEGKNSDPPPSHRRRAALARQRAKYRRSSPQGSEASPRSRANRFRSQRLNLEQGEPSEVTRRVREVFQLSKGMGNKPSNGQESSPNETK